MRPKGLDRSRASDPATVPGNGTRRPSGRLAGMSRVVQLRDQPHGRGQANRRSRHDPAPPILLGRAKSPVHGCNHVDPREMPSFFAPMPQTKATDPEGLRERGMHRPPIPAAILPAGNLTAPPATGRDSLPDANSPHPGTGSEKWHHHQRSECVRPRCSPPPPPRSDPWHRAR